MSQGEAEESGIKRMADLLRQGTTLTELACPACSSPLFRLKNRDLWCARCEKKVVVMKEGEEPKIRSAMILENLETTLLAKIRQLQDRMQEEENAEELQKLGVALSSLLGNLEKVWENKKNLGNP